MTVTVERAVEAEFLIRKRDGRVEPFSKEKLAESIRRAVLGAGLGEPDASGLIEALVAEFKAKARASSKGEAALSAKVIADTVERSMIERLINNALWEEAAKRYVLARIYNHVYGKGGWSVFDPADLRLTFNALKVLESRYLLKDPETSRFRETPALMFRRVARVLASIEARYGKSEEEVKRIEEEFYRILSELRFIPNSPTLMNAGTRLGVLSACFVIPVRDAMTTPRGDGIMDAARATALIQQQGGGTGFDFSELRPEGDMVASTAGVASGPLSFMKLFDTVTEVIKQGGKRRGANMGILHVWHPDIEKFIKSKSGELKDTILQNFNISVAVYDQFMKAVENKEKWPLINPRKTFLLPGEPFDSRFYAIVRARHNLSEEWVAEYIIHELEQHDGSIPLHESLIITLDEAIAIAENENAITRQVDAKELYWKIVHSAWDSGDPGMIFIDEINRRHPTWYLGKIQSTNPCVTGDTRITTARGLVRADELREGDMVWTPFGWAPIKEVIDNGEKDIYKLEFDNGLILYATPEHELFTPGGWVPVEKLREGTRIRIVIEPAPSYPKASFSRPVDGLLPKEGSDEEVAEFLGLWVGDGYLSSSGHVSIAVGESDGLASYIESLMGKMFGNAYKIFKKAGEGTFGTPGIVVDVHRKQAVTLLKYYFPELGSRSYSREKQVPEAIMKAPLSVQKAFLRGLFTSDGTVSFSATTLYVALSSKSMKLLRDVQIMLYAMGIPATLTKGKGDEHRIVLSGWRAIRFIKEVGFMGEKQKKAEQLIEHYKKAPYPPKYEESEWITLVHKEKVGKKRVYDVVSPPFYVWSTNGILSLDCGEEPLLEWENCNLGSINLERYVVGGGVDWEGLARDVRVAVRFLDNVIDANRHPLRQISEANRRTRKIGLGVMGWARMLVRLGVRYDSPEAIVLGWRLAEWIAFNAYLESAELAGEKGTFPAWDPGLYRPAWRTLRFRGPDELLRMAGVDERITDERVLRILRDAPRADWDALERKIAENGLRNAAVMSIAPTGSISIIAGASSSIEPLFALAFMRYVSVGTFMEVDRLFLEYLAKYELDEPELIKEIAKTGSIAHIPYLPRTLRRLFRTAHDIDPEWHVLHQAAWQAWVDAAVSKTVNLRSDEPPETVWRVYMLAWRLGCKGITVYRDKSKSRQVIEFGLKTAKEKARSRLTIPKRIEENRLPPPPSRRISDAESPMALRPKPQGEKKLGLTAMKLELEKKLEEAIRNTRLTLSRVRIGKEEYVAVAEEYAGGCPTCDI